MTLEPDSTEGVEAVNIKANAWGIAADYLLADAHDRLDDRTLSPEQRKVWNHILKVVVPSLRQRERIILRRKPSHAMGESDP